MFEIIIAEHLGFCFGVKRAITIIEDIAKKNKKEKIYTLGPIIHNPQTVLKLKKKGISVLDDIDDIKTGTVVLRTHGVEKNILEKIKKKNIEIIDATCPFVSKAQDYVRKLNKENYPVIIIGEKDHPEVMALKSQIKNNVYVIETKKDFPLLKKINSNRVGVVSQTTQDEINFKKMVFVLFDYFKDVHVYNTICNATYLRQKAAIELAKKSDLMIIIGGYNSANTKRLYNLCVKILKRTHQVETDKDIKEEWFIKNIKCVGIAAGASTPDWIINKVIKKLEKINIKEETKNDGK